LWNYSIIESRKNEARRKQDKESADLPTGAYIEVRNQEKHSATTKYEVYTPFQEKITAQQ
jgi:hypothetical protein